MHRQQIDGLIQNANENKFYNTLDWLFQLLYYNFIYILEIFSIMKN